MKSIRDTLKTMKSKVLLGCNHNEIPYLENLQEGDSMWLQQT